MIIRNIIISFITCTFLILGSCGKEFLNITQNDKLTGNNYWTSAQDVERFVSGIYSSFREATMQSIFFPATGDFRCAPIIRSSYTQGEGRQYLDFLRNNNLNTLFARVNGGDFGFYSFNSITNWSVFYQMVQNSNILYDQLENYEMPFLSASQKSSYKAEAVFLRNLAFFFMVRLYGDIPYYTNVNTDPLPRENMLTVLKNISADLDKHYKDLPWTFEDQNIVAVRAMRGSALALNMHVNMWLAGFTVGDKSPYYSKVANYGKELMEENGGAYELLPYSRTKEIFKGRTKEGLFEIVQNLNFGERFSNTASFSDYVLRSPNKAVPESFIYYDSKFFEKMWPAAEKDADDRVKNWFDEFIFDASGKFQCLKFLNVFRSETEDVNPDDNQMVFRYTDAVLLRAEALAEMNNDGEAREVLNLIRTRANVPTSSTISGDALKDLIWWERARELFGESHFYYDLVRTGKVISTEYTTAPMTITAFRNGGWTWPIDKAALLNNPFMRLNNFWN